MRGKVGGGLRVRSEGWALALERARVSCRSPV
jgi:hypothetical protein